MYTVYCYDGDGVQVSEAPMPDGVNEKEASQAAAKCCLEGKDGTVCNVVRRGSEGTSCIFSVRRVGGKAVDANGLEATEWMARRIAEREAIRKKQEEEDVRRAAERAKTMR